MRLILSGKIFVVRASRPRESPNVRGASQKSKKNCSGLTESVRKYLVKINGIFFQYIKQKFCRGNPPVVAPKPPCVRGGKGGHFAIYN